LLNIILVVIISKYGDTKDKQREDAKKNEKEKEEAKKKDKE
jgi:hypothetical protein